MGISVGKKKLEKKKTQKKRFWYFKCILKTKKIAREAKLSAKDNMYIAQ
jgi:hypothetical protein